MRVLFVSYPHVGLGNGGMYHQIIKTKDALEQAGCTVLIHNFLKNNLNDIDICHVFGSHSANYGIVNYCASKRIPVFVSPVFNRFGVSKFRMRFERLLSKRIPGFLSELKYVSSLLRASHTVLALNTEELRLLGDCFPETKNKITVLPNGIDLDFVPAEKVIQKDNAVLCVGEISERKNQLNLIRSAEGSDWDLYLVGKVPDNKYGNRCKDEAERLSNVHILGELPYGGDQLRDLYTRSKVFCLPSFSEVQPLTILEAAGFNCEIVTSETYPVHDFLTDICFLVSPGSVDSIREQIKRAIDSNSNSYERISSQVSWAKIGERLITLYCAVVSDE